MTAAPRLAAGDVPAPGGEVPTLGVEEEFLLLRPDGRTALIAPDVLAAVGPGVRAQSEFVRCQVETATGICAELGTIGRELAAARGELAAAADDRGARLVASGTPPFDRARSGRAHRRSALSAAGGHGAGGHRRGDHLRGARARGGRLA